jgi:hypothetical protein
MFQSGQLVRVNLAGLQAEGVMFRAAVTDAVGHIVKQTSETTAQVPRKAFILLPWRYGSRSARRPHPRRQVTHIRVHDIKRIEGELRL